MLLYNITAIVDLEIHTAWLQQVQEQFIPGVMATGLFVSHRTLKVLDSPNEGITYCIQFIADTLDSYHLYISNYRQKALEQLNKDYENKFVLFTTLMEYIDQQ